MKRFAIVIDANGKFFLADRVSNTRQEMIATDYQGAPAWKSVVNGRLFVPADSVMGYFAMGEYEFEHNPESGYDRNEFTCVQA